MGDVTDGHFIVQPNPKTRQEIDDAGVYVGEIPYYIQNPYKNERWLYVCGVCLDIINREDRDYDAVLNGRPYFCGELCRKKWAADRTGDIEKNNTADYLKKWHGLIQVSETHRLRLERNL